MLPIILLSLLSFQQVMTLQTRVNDLEKIKDATHFIEHLSSAITTTPTSVEVSLETITLLHNLQKPLIKKLFSDNASFLEQMPEFTDSVNDLYESTDVFEVYDAIESQIDIVGSALIDVEKVSYGAAPQDIKEDLSALIKIEWLMLWGIQENALSHLLYEGFQVEGEYDPDIADEIRALVQNQQLSLERFISLNADEQQIEMMLAVFGNELFSQSREFRQQLLSLETLSEITEEEATLGFSVLQQRKSLLNAVADSIETQLRAEVDINVSEAQQQIMLFTLTIILIVLSVIIVSYRFSSHMTKNLYLVLDFLTNEKTPDGQALTSHIKGKDEINTFATEVERLTIERKHAQENLVHAIDAAEEAKDEAIMASKAKSSFLANMSHEIRTPLNGVIGISEVLSDTELSATQREYVDTIETSSHLLLTLINDILDFSKIESGMLIVNPHASCIRETVFDLASIVMPKVKEKGIGLNIEIEPNLPYSLMIDDHRLSQILMNFMSNAVKFTSEGSVDLTIRCLDIQDEIASVEFAVKDSGIGIEPEQQRKIFEPFSQEDSSTTRQFGGTGLGLAISTQLVELMGDKIRLDSEKGLGSRFSFTLKLKIDKHDYTPKRVITSPVYLITDDLRTQKHVAAEMNIYKLPISHFVDNLDNLSSAVENSIIIFVESTPGQASSRLDTFQQLQSQNNRVCVIQHFSSVSFDYARAITALVTTPLYGQRLVKAIDLCDKTATIQQASVESVPQVARKILIVEDNKVNQKIASLHVNRLGFEFEIANNGQEAVDMVASGGLYDLLLMDCMMPVKDGFQAVLEIRQWEIDNQKERTPIIALTASVVDDDVQRCFDVGMDSFVQKPFKGNQLKEKVFEALNTSVVDTPLVSNQPANSTATEPAHQSSAKAVPIPVQDKSEKVMLVEDNRVNQMVASLLLEKAGYQFQIANNGQEAINTYINEGDFDIILMDCMMPIKDGFDATKEIRAYEEKQGLERTPIIALTASVIDDDIQRCFDSGMDAYVPKPIKKENLLQQMQNVV
ncbi:response regulator [Vibrio sp. FNV 38]|nr:response regulator [Vibrio sp. FNV 38]